MSSVVRFRWPANAATEGVCWAARWGRRGATVRRRVGGGKRRVFTELRACAGGRADPRGWPEWARSRRREEAAHRILSSAASRSPASGRTHEPCHIRHDADPTVRGTEARAYGNTAARAELSKAVGACTRGHRSGRCPRQG